jgi:ABC-type multidrug transport system fused ATPase/permease subunit
VISHLLRCFRLLDRRAKATAGVLGIMILLTTLLEAAGIGLIFPLIKMIAEPSLIQENEKLRWAYNYFGFESNKSFMVFAILSVGAVIVFKNFFVLFNILWQHKFTYDNEAKVSAWLFAIYLTFPYSESMQRNSADFIFNVSNGVYVTFRDTILAAISLLSEICVIGAVSFVLLMVEPIIAILAGGLLGIGLGVFYLLFRRKFSELGIKDREFNRNATQWLQQSFHSSKEIRSLGRESFFIKQYRNIRVNLNKVHFVYVALSQMPRIFIEVIAVVCMLSVILFIIVQERSIGDLMALLGLFAVAAFRMMPSASKIVFYLGQLRKAAPSVVKVIADLEQYADLQGEVHELQYSERLPFKNKIDLERISYRYPSRDELVLADINLTINQGESIALVGVSGAGKTTLADMMLGLLDPESGTIEVDGKDISSNIAAWRTQLGYVPQSVYLTDDTLCRNIAFGLSDEVINDDLINRAVSLAQLNDVVEALPDGLDTVLGEHGVRLSGGQRQRVGIARAVYHQPQVLILDEATSALDNETEQEVTRAINGLSGQLTLIVIAHRLSTIQNCDRIVFLKAGRIIGVGKFDELQNSLPEMNQMVRLGQLKSEEISQIES